MTFAIHGLAVSRGIAIGRAVVVASSRMEVVHYFIRPDQVEAEIQRARTARNAVIDELRRLQEEVIELEDLKTGVSITDLGLNDFRMDLLNYVKAHGELSNVPNGMHAVVPAQPAMGLRPGVIFTLRNRNSGVNLNQHNRLHPYYLVYINREGGVIHDHTEVKRLLDLVRSCCKGQDKPIVEAFQRFNQETADGRRMQPYSDLLGKAIRSMIEVKEEKDLDSLFTGGKTTALTGTISGLDDFELISFLVIQEAG